MFSEFPLLIEKHISYFKLCLNALPGPYVSIDTGRLSAIYFAVTALDILGEIDSIDKISIVNYIYGMQIKASENNNFPGHNGFIGSTFLGQPFRDSSITQNEYEKLNIKEDIPVLRNYVQGHLAMTYTALATLTTLEDNLERVDRVSILEGIKKLQQPDGSFQATFGGSECDLRFLYCACAVSTFLNDWSAVNQEGAVRYIRSCITYEGGFSLTPGSEAHGGSTYCGIASLSLMNRLDSLSTQEKEELLAWCMHRQIRGFQGRTNKDPDTCYSFWIGATIQILNEFHNTDIPSTASFILQSCQFTSTGICCGGFSKVPRNYPDLLHSFYSICWLAMAAAADTDNNLITTHLKTINPSLGICLHRINHSSNNNHSISNTSGQEIK